MSPEQIHYFLERKRIITLVVMIQIYASRTTSMVLPWLKSTKTANAHSVKVGSIFVNWPMGIKHGKIEVTPNVITFSILLV